MGFQQQKLLLFFYGDVLLDATTVFVQFVLVRKEQHGGCAKLLSGSGTSAAKWRIWKLHRVTGIEMTYSASVRRHFVTLKQQNGHSVLLFGLPF